jgi:hypothetical protein
MLSVISLSRTQSFPSSACSPTPAPFTPRAWFPVTMQLSSVRFALVWMPPPSPWWLVGWSPPVMRKFSSVVGAFAKTSKTRSVPWASIVAHPELPW